MERTVDEQTLLEAKSIRSSALELKDLSLEEEEIFFQSSLNVEGV